MNEQGSPRNHELEEQEQRVQEELRRLHELQRQQGAGEFANFLEKDAGATADQRMEGQNKRFSPDIPGITRPEIPQHEIPTPPSETTTPLENLNASLSRGQESLAEKVIDGKVDQDPADLVNLADQLMQTSKEE